MCVCVCVFPSRGSLKAVKYQLFLFYFIFKKGGGGGGGGKGGARAFLAYREEHMQGCVPCVAGEARSASLDH